MSNLIPPLVSTSPPPIVGPLDDEDDDEIDEFRTSNTLYDFDDSSLPSTPTRSPEKSVNIDEKIDLDINRNKNNEISNSTIPILTADAHTLNNISDTISSDITKQNELDEDIDDAPSEIQVNSIIDSHKDHIDFQKFVLNSSNTKLEEPFSNYINTKNSKQNEDILITNEENIPNTGPKNNSAVTEEKEEEIEKQASVLKIENCDNSANDDIIEKHLNNCDYKIGVQNRILHDDDEDDNQLDCPTDLNSCTNDDDDDDFGNFETHLNVVESDISGKNFNETVNNVTNDLGSKCSELNQEEEFGNFEFNTRQTSEDDGDDDEFGNFEFSKTSNVEKNDSAHTGIELSNCISDEQKEISSDKDEAYSIKDFKAKEDDDPFTDFDSGQSDNFELPKGNDSLEENLTQKHVNDDFTDFESANNFANFETTSCSTNNFELTTASPRLLTSETKVSNDNDDDFGDFENFTDFTSSNEPVLLLDSKNVFKKSETILKDIFRTNENDSVEDFRYIDQTNDSAVFIALKEVTETNALTYQWSKSNSQKLLLKSLNIDTRNILYGAVWNSSMPRFAATLGSAPLEPIKSESLPSTLLPSPNQLTPTITTPPPPPLPLDSSSTNTAVVDIPTAQFDWNGAGLVNPLDYSQTVLLDLEQLVASLDIPSTTTTLNSTTSNPSPSLSNELLEEWDIWLQSATPTEPTPSTNDDVIQDQEKPDLFLSNILETKNEIKPKDTGGGLDFEVFQNAEDLTTHHSSNIKLNDFSPFDSPKIIPLRETHISNDDNKSDWLQVTLTPELAKKDFTSDQIVDDDDDFDDFQMVLPEQSSAATVIKPELDADFGFFTSATTDIHIEKTYHSDLKQEVPVQTPPSLTLEKPPTFNREQNHEGEDDDEFTDFQSSLPVVQAPKPLPSVPLEPLKPILQYMPTPTQINWPDPGITEEDIQRFELSYSRNNPLDQVVEKIQNPVEIVELPRSNESRHKINLISPPPIRFAESSNVVKQENMSKIVNNDDDEWCDFISVQSQKEPERTSTPDLALSVLNLNYIQPAKPPIPVITPNGLVQTKLSVNSPTHPKSSNVVQTTIPSNPRFQQPQQYQPSIISNQMNHLQNSLNGNMDFINNFMPLNSVNPLPKTVAASTAEDDDDDWSDFVSSQPPASQSSLYNQQSKANYSKAPPVGQPINWTTNITTNPSHFDSFKNYKNPVNTKKNAFMNGQSVNSIASISAMPELDFIAPKSRNHKK